ncbi:CidA/LrgA family protein [Chelatococcus sambhunathii]|uniref:CidA/LrgA family protein n=1 Tax=Chelatococcus sambhunathii TaxID=363953 RepID=A0ABU1DBM7_9HYPH|nr:CidA/LrgA family protein [Chelatococcus sambhunathii]MDR4305517.1 CidA/LrgA family protein [Chelatococcus sambhunathii]
MIKGLAALLLFQLFGESIVFLTGLAVPGPVVGLMLLFAAMLTSARLGRSSWKPVEDASGALLANLGLLFVPAGVGVVALGRFVEGQTLAIGFVLVLSAVLTLGATMLAFVGARRLLGGGDPE